MGALNEQQTEAFVSEDKRLLVLADAGSGKTKTLLQRIVFLIEEKGVSPSHILARGMKQTTSSGGLRARG